MASAGPYANNLHLAPDRKPHQNTTAQFFTGQIPFLPPNQQRQSTEGQGPLPLHEQLTTRNKHTVNDVTF